VEDEDGVEEPRWGWVEEPRMGWVEEGWGWVRGVGRGMRMGWGGG